MDRVRDLFGCEPVFQGLRVADDLLSAQEEAQLIAAIDAEGLAPFRFQGWLGKRLTRSFGWSYDFETGRFAQAAPLPAWLLPLRQRAAGFAGLDADALAQALLIRYDPGAGIGWHKDRPVFEHVVGISLGHAATLRFRRRNGNRFERRSAELPPRSVYHLSDAARHVWEHSIAPLALPRWSITFRSLSHRARDQAASLTSER